MIHISQIKFKPDTIEYWRKPTKEEVKFGYGTIHFRDFKFEKCFDENGFLKLKVRTNDDALIYFYSGREKEKHSQIHKIEA